MRSKLSLFVNCLSRLVIRGTHDDFATLCTSDQVFEMKTAETSNTLLLASPLDSSLSNKENGCVSLKVVQTGRVPFLESRLKNSSGQFNSSLQI